VETIVFMNDEKTVDEVIAMKPAGILVSPGPGTPEDSGISMAIIEKAGPLGIPIFGVCMGHQVSSRRRRPAPKASPCVPPLLPPGQPPQARTYTPDPPAPPRPAASQCMGQVFSGSVIRAPCGVMHGKTSPVFHNGEGLFAGLPNPLEACRYHSLVIARDETFPEDELEITAWTEDQTIMGVRHKKYPKIQGVQFHPESIITQQGRTIVKNFVDTLA